MKYMLAIYNDEKAGALATPEQNGQLFGGYMAFTEEIKKKGFYVAGDPLKPAATATTVRQPVGANAVTTDGPYAETKEQMGGYYIVDCPDLDQALACAKQICALHTFNGVCVEVRPILDLSAMMHG
ncbi:MAG: YciI family protein [Bryobacteraceae bacterium]|nr:YciI family protein [Bryobacteraceae bacterium]